MGNITVIGVGFSREQLTLGAADLLKKSLQVILHTERCGVTEFLNENNIEYRSLDYLYEEYEDFDEHADAAAEAVNAAAENGDVLYCVMDIRDKSAALLAEEGAKIIPGPVSEGALMAFAAEATQLYAASDWEDMHPDAGLCTIVREIDTKELACEVKLRLMEAYPDDADVIIESAGEIRKISLYDLDRTGGYDHRFSALIMAEKDAGRLNDISMRRLVEAARANDDVYKEGDAAELADSVARIAGAIAYAEDRGEYTTADIMIDARDVIMD
ncbi:MAG: hypothetical protein IJC56_00480 [Clostridia bacterium]|nr:hypothetical protein [Clostridia bacterium]